jgi:hypothetical protein
MQSEFLQKLDNLSKIGYKDVTVSDLVAKLAGLPPMMEVYVNADGISMFLNDALVEQKEGFPPFFRLFCGTVPVVPKPPSVSYEEALDQQRQRAMQMSRNSQEAQRMPKMEEVL